MKNVLASYIYIFLITLKVEKLMMPDKLVLVSEIQHSKSQPEIQMFGLPLPQEISGHNHLSKILVNYL